MTFRLLGKKEVIQSPSLVLALLTKEKEHIIFLHLEKKSDKMAFEEKVMGKKKKKKTPAFLFWPNN